MENRPGPPAAKRTVSLSAEQSRYVDTLVASGDYASASEVVRAGLQALQERDASTEHWLRTAVLPVYDAMQGEPGRGLTGEDVAVRLQAHHAARLSRRGG